jgi:hypothetical protein
MKSVTLLTRECDGTRRVLRYEWLEPARRAARESDGVEKDLGPRVALADSGNPGLNDATPLVSLVWRAMREKSLLSD